MSEVGEGATVSATSFLCGCLWPELLCRNQHGRNNAAGEQQKAHYDCRGGEQFTRVVYATTQLDR